MEPFTTTMDSAATGVINEMHKNVLHAGLGLSKGDILQLQVNFLAAKVQTLQESNINGSNIPDNPDHHVRQFNDMKHDLEHVWTSLNQRVFALASTIEGQGMRMTVQQAKYDLIMSKIKLIEDDIVMMKSKLELLSMENN